MYPYVETAFYQHSRDAQQDNRWVEGIPPPWSFKVKVLLKGDMQRGTTLALSGAISSFYTHGSNSHIMFAQSKIANKMENRLISSAVAPKRLLLPSPSVVSFHYCSSSVPFLFLLISSPLPHLYFPPQPFNLRHDKSVILSFFCRPQRHRKWIFLSLKWH